MRFFSLHPIGAKQFRLHPRDGTQDVADAIDQSEMDRSNATCPKGATGGGHQMYLLKTADVFASVFSIGVPVNPMKEAFGKASRRLLAKP